jgi:Alw26I/Eco31I/Esp3I family type II restriction m6 adenine DNA methyltransferase
MLHIERIGKSLYGDEAFIKRATGRFYTHSMIAEHMINALIPKARLAFAKRETLSICDPFCGDGRLIKWLLEHRNSLISPRCLWRISMWDIDGANGSKGAEGIEEFCKQHGINAEVCFTKGDAFQLGRHCSDVFDITLTNPPWELIKPDSRELKELSNLDKQRYISSMKEYDSFLISEYPLSQPKSKFAGWGTNLSRVGLELCYRITSSGGFVAAVMPASFLADAQSFTLRKHLLTSTTLHDAAYFPAEAKLFEKADVVASSVLFQRKAPILISPTLSKYDKTGTLVGQGTVSLEKEMLEKLGFVVPIAFGASATKLLSQLNDSFVSWADLEGNSRNSLWSGREIDETSSSKWLVDLGDAPLFIKGRMINRYEICEWPTKRAAKPSWTVPESVSFERIAWRDVSRPNQKRRVIATLLPPGIAAGNSIGVCYFRDGNKTVLRSLLGIMNSACFEFQLRSHLATGHVSLSSLRKVRVPSREKLEKLTQLACLVDQALGDDQSAIPQIEAAVARDVYGYSLSEFELILSQFAKLSREESDSILACYTTNRTQFSRRSRKSVTTI